MSHANQGARFALKNGEPLQALRFGRSSATEAVASNGEINAYDRKDALRNIDRLMIEASSGRIVRTVEQKEQAQQLLASAINDPTGNIWRDMEVAVAAEINETAAREGFLRRFVIEEPLSQGQTPKIRQRYRNVVAVISESPTDINHQIIRDKYFYPPEFNIVANIEIEEREIAQATGDILDEKYNEGLQAIMVQEDRVWKNLADGTVGAANDLTTITGALTPNYLMAIQQKVTDWKLPATQTLISNDYWKDIVTNSNWLAAFDPVTRAEILLTGRLGSVYGMEISTDGFRPPELKVLDQGELYVTSSPEYHGAITTRGGVVPTPLNGPLNSRTTRGWFLSELMSAMITNSRSVAKARRQ